MQHGYVSNMCTQYTYEVRGEKDPIVDNQMLQIHLSNRSTIFPPRPVHLHYLKHLIVLPAVRRVFN